jgi:hypothetical protein
MILGPRSRAQGHRATAGTAATQSNAQGHRAAAAGTAWTTALEPWTHNLLTVDHICEHRVLPIVTQKLTSCHSCPDIDTGLLEDGRDPRLEVPLLRTIGVDGETHILCVLENCSPWCDGIRQQCHDGDGDHPGAVCAMAAENEDIVAQAQRLHNQREGCIHSGLP